MQSMTALGYIVAVMRVWIRNKLTVNFVKYILLQHLYEEEQIPAWRVGVLIIRPRHPRHTCRKTKLKPVSTLHES
jgi:hypothetical protein